MATTDEKRKKPAYAIVQTESIIESQLPSNRRDEILQYLSLFGYKPDKTILQVHISGFFRKRDPTSRDASQRAASARRYGGTTFVIVGRTHDPSIMDKVIPPRKSREKAKPGYVGYLWTKRNQGNAPPHEILPIDFTPAQLHYPDDWKRLYSTKGFLIAMHVPTSFASRNNALLRALYREAKNADPKTEWSFIERVKQNSFGHNDGVEGIHPKSASAA